MESPYSCFWEKIHYQPTNQPTNQLINCYQQHQFYRTWLMPVQKGLFSSPAINKFPYGGANFVLLVFLVSVSDGTYLPQSPNNFLLKLYFNMYVYIPTLMFRHNYALTLLIKLGVTLGNSNNKKTYTRRNTNKVLG